MPYGWTAEQLRAAIERCEAETEKMIQDGAKPEDIYHRRHGIETLREMLRRAEAGEAEEAGGDEPQ